MLVLGIESTCDETACALVRDGREILSNVVTSQIDLHSEYGGVVPELCCRRHVDVIIPVIKQALHDARATLSDVDLIAVAHGPGLIGALLIGLTAAKALSLATGIPFIGVNHIEAHLYAAMMSQEQPVEFPCLGIVLSGGHTALVRIDAIGSYVQIGGTVDDAIGEAFDKAAKIIGLPYPGGPYIEALAAHGKHNRYTLKPGKVKGRPFDFSFSGLKTGVLYAVKGQNCQSQHAVNDQDKADIAAAFQQAAFADVIEKTLAAADLHSCRTLVFGGGVTNNCTLKRMFAEKAPSHTTLWPSMGLSLDNAAMIAGLGYHSFNHKGKGDGFELEAATRIW